MFCKKSKFDQNDVESDTESSSEDEDDSEEVEVTPPLSLNLQSVVKKVRNTVKIKPTSVEAECAFSALGLFANKIRNHLNDDTIDALTFMRQYYNK